MTTEPYASARRVFWVVDNGSSHNGQASTTRMQARWPTARMIHLPVHASWLNQVEIYFSILQGRVTPDELTTVTTSCGSVTGASRFLIGLVTCLATHDGIPDVLRGRPEPLVHDRGSSTSSGGITGYRR